MLKCPVCGELLVLFQNNYKCNNSHGFDLSKTGHVNLLLANQKSSKDPGDSKEMVNSRYDFLNKGYYKVISEGLNKFVSQNLDKSLGKVNILDIGCGTGYYLNNLHNHLKTKGINTNAIGLDISKNAIIKASKSDKDNEIQWIIGSSYNLPIIDSSRDVLINVFAPYAIEEFSRVLSEGGAMYFVVPNSGHLNELCDIFFGDEKQEKTHDKFKTLVNDVDGLKINNYVDVRNKITLHNNEDISNLLKMTPYYWKIKKEIREKVLQIDNIEVGIDVRIYSVMKSDQTI